MNKSAQKSKATSDSGFMPLDVIPGAAAWTAIMTESARFMAERLEEDVKTQQELLKCRSPEDLMRVQSEFFRNAVAQYVQEATRMAELLTQSASKSAKLVQNTRSRSYDDVPL